MSGMRRSSDAGSMLVELSVTVAILGLVLGSAMAGFISFQSASQGQNERVLDLSEAQLLMDTSTKDLRTATRIEVAGKTPPDVITFQLAADREVVFYGNVDNATGPNLVHLWIDAGSKLWESFTPPDPGSVPNFWTYSQGTPRVHFVAQYITNDLATPVFTYYDKSNNVLPTSPSDCPPAGQYSTAGAISCLDPTPALPGGAQVVHAVAVTYVVRHTTTLSVAPTTLTNRVRLLNLDYNPSAAP